MVNQSLTLDGHGAIISGAGGDIGRAVARELARRGASVALGDVRDPEDVPGLLRSMLDASGRPVRGRYDQVDVSDAQAVRQWVDDVAQDLGPADLIVPNAAVVRAKPIRDLSPQTWNSELSINLNGAFHLAQAGALRLLADHKPGRIVFMGSWAAHRPHTHIPTYCAAKAGIRALCQTMALDLAPDGILVNEVAPGFVDAGLTGKGFENHPEKREEARAHVPIGKLIEPEEVALQVAHLCEPANQHTTGSVLLMDGGLSLLSGQ